MEVEELLSESAESTDSAESVESAGSRTRRLKIVLAGIVMVTMVVLAGIAVVGTNSSDSSAMFLMDAKHIEDKYLRLEPATGHERTFSALFSGKAHVLVEADEPLFHEAGVWIQSSQEWLVTSNRLLPGTDDTHIRIVALKADGSYRFLEHLEKKITMGNGGTSDGKGGAILLSQGLRNMSGAIWHVAPDLESVTLIGPLAQDALLARNTTPPVDHFNSMNDIQMHTPSGRLIFTDPAYGYLAQGFRDNSNSIYGLWMMDPQTNKWQLIDSDYHAPNGILLSLDEKKLYVTDVWNSKWQSGGDIKEKAIKREVVQYDVHYTNNQLSFTNRRMFVDLSTTTTEVGHPDGLKTCMHGNIYIGTGDGMRVYQPDGTYLGRLRVDGGCANLCFGGRDGRTLLLFCEKIAVAVPMNVSGDPRLFLS